MAYCSQTLANVYSSMIERARLMKALRSNREYSSLTSIHFIDFLWGDRARLRYLLIATIFLIFTLLGAKDIWTQEHRWAEIVWGMFYRHDFLHPYLGEIKYYDKPLLSYWLIALFAKLTGYLSVWVLRFPSALAGLLAVYSIYWLGTELKSKQLGLLAGWLLLTTFYFVFWARVSSADMLNLAGALFAVAWYMAKREQGGFYNYTVFFTILALTSLCKGLGGAIVALLVVFVDVLLRKSWKDHLRVSLLGGLGIGLCFYLLPFLASNYWGESYGQNGLYLVYRENILRYFQPFDHKGPLYTYFIYLPIYLFPWTLLFLPILLTIKWRWRMMSISSRWMVLSFLLLFAFFTFSGSRRSYYVLPIVPFAILITADGLLTLEYWSKWRVWVGRMVVIVFVILFLVIDLIPAWYYSQQGIERFTQQMKYQAEQRKPWKKWNLVLLDAESKLNFYLYLPPQVKQYYVHGNRDEQTSKTLLAAWPIIKNKPQGTIFISRKRYLPALENFFEGYQVVSLTKDPDSPIAFIPV